MTQHTSNKHPVIVEMDDEAVGVLVPVDGRFEFVANDRGPVNMHSRTWRSVAEALHDIRQHHDRRKRDKNEKGAA